VPAGAFHEAPAEALPYEADAFDLVFMGVVLHEVDDHLQALREARRVARLRVAVLEWPHRRMTVGPPLWHRLKPEQVQALAEEAGFQAVEGGELAQTVLYRLEV
jgi:SAM-dependent methyltransferase